jgi:biotin synthase
MGETREDIIDLAFALRELEVDSLPVNFLIPIDGTPFEGRRELSPTDCLRALCLFRLTNPAAEIRMAGGGEGNLGWFRPLALHVANSIFVDGYLTTPGQAYREAQTMVTEMGFEIEREPVSRSASAPVRENGPTG